MFKKILNSLILVTIVLFIASAVLTGCKGSNKGAGETLTVEQVDPNDPSQNGGSNNGNTQDNTQDNAQDNTQDIPSTSNNGLHPLFSGPLGVPVSRMSLGAVLNDETGFSLDTDFDGDGIENNDEVLTSQYVADYPRIVTRISAPITMEIRVSETNTTDNLAETLEDNNMKSTISNSMEDKQYTQANKKTTPIPTKESQSDSASNSEAHGYSVSASISSHFSMASIGGGGSVSGSYSENESFANSFAKSTASETTLFKDIDYVDNLDRNGVEFTNSTVKDIVKNYKNYLRENTTTIIPPNAGIVRAALYIKNTTVNMPVLVSNILCTLSFRTPAGAFLPVKTFRLRHDDYSIYEQEIYGGEEFGPYTIEITDLNTAEVKKALANGYVPQIHVVSYDLRPVMDSNYRPGVENLKVIEETAKGRTATIKIVGTNMRELYRVAAFDVDEDDIEETVSPGISLKKALFNTFRKKIGSGEIWETDANKSQLTVLDTGLKWKAGFVPDPEQDPNGYKYNKDGDGNYINGNSWDFFETYVKTYTDEYNQVHRIETVKRIGTLEKYNPFDPADNSSYDPNALMSESEIAKMKYWVIFHNGRYFEGDINDPIWAGERYEVVCFDVYDFSQHFTTFSYTPLQSMEDFYLETRWNNLTNEGEFARAKYLGTVLKDDVIHLVLDLYESRLLFDTTQPFDAPFTHTDPSGYDWSGFNYTFEPLTKYEPGIPKSFTHMAEGGSNNIKVTILNESALAHGYDISFGQRNTAQTEWKTVRFTTEEFKKSGGVITITRRTIDKTNNPVGRIDGGIEYIEYTVNIKAYGESYGQVPVTTKSSSNNSVHVLVRNPESGTQPGPFTFGVIGSTNQLDVSISESLNVKAEFYLIRYYGPLNPEYSASYQEIEKIGQAGLNTFSIPKPYGQITEPGVYRVMVYAVNGTGITGSGAGTIDENLITPSSIEEQFFTVSYERYTSQKEYRGRISKALHQVDEILDLEVNFNDGTGWYQLRVGSEINEQYLDCRFNSYVEYDKNRFHIFFKAPAGSLDEPASQYNVFMGGREEADIYIRTIAKPEYRDTFWLKPKANDNDYYPAYESLGDGYSSPGSYIFIPTIADNFVDWWIANAGSDATNLENALGSHEYSDLSTVPGNGFALVDNTSTPGIGSISEYFYSPKKHNVFIASASLMDTLQAPTVNASLNRPTFTAAAGDRCINITDMSSNLADNFIVYWKIGNAGDLGQYENIENTYVWTQAEVTADNYKIDGLNENTNYIVAVVAKRGSLYSNPKFWNDPNTGNDPTRENIVSIRPYSTVAPQAPNTFSLSLGADGISIRVANIYSPGMYRYQVQWRTASTSSWSSSGTIENLTSGNPNYSPMTYTITGLAYWQHYYVRVRAVRENNSAYSLWSDLVYIETEEDSITYDITVTWDDNIQYDYDYEQVDYSVYNYWYYYRATYTVEIPAPVFPVGTVSYRIPYYNIVTTAYSSGGCTIVLGPYATGYYFGTSTSVNGNASYWHTYGVDADVSFELICKNIYDEEISIPLSEFANGY